MFEDRTTENLKKETLAEIEPATGVSSMAGSYADATVGPLCQAVSRLYKALPGVLSMLFPTLHAFGLTMDNGIEILVHIGLDTVALNGRGFASKLKMGAPVKKGTEIVRVDREFILGQGYNPMTMMIFTNTNGHTMKFVTEGNVRKGRSVVAAF